MTKRAFSVLAQATKPSETWVVHGGGKKKWSLEAWSLLDLTLKSVF